MLIFVNKIARISGFSHFFHKHAQHSSNKSFVCLCQVPWPVSLVLGKESLAQYNGVFCFLLQIKRALNRLQRLSFKG